MNLPGPQVHQGFLEANPMEFDGRDRARGCRAPRRL